MHIVWIEMIEQNFGDKIYEVFNWISRFEIRFLTKFYFSSLKTFDSLNCCPFDTDFCAALCDIGNEEETKKKLNGALFLSSFNWHFAAAFFLLVLFLFTFFLSAYVKLYSMKFARIKDSIFYSSLFETHRQWWRILNRFRLVSNSSKEISTLKSRHTHQGRFVKAIFVVSFKH